MLILLAIGFGILFFAVIYTVLYPEKQRPKVVNAPGYSEPRVGIFDAGASIPSDASQLHHSSHGSSHHDAHGDFGSSQHGGHDFGGHSGFDGGHGGGDAGHSGGHH